MSIATRPEIASPVAVRSSEKGPSPFLPVIPVGACLRPTPADFELQAAANRDLRLELAGSEDLSVMALEGCESEHRNFGIAVMLGIWIRANGIVDFGSSAGVTLPIGAIRAPDAAWISSDRWHGLPASERSGLARIAPDFVVELRWPSDNIDDCRKKMSEYASLGVRPGWLIDPESKTVTIYRPGQEPQLPENPERVSGDDVLPDFELETRSIFSG